MWTSVAPAWPSAVQASASVGLGSVSAVRTSVSAWVVAYAAAARVGATTAGVNPRLTDHERRSCLDRVQPALVVEHASDVDALARVGGSLPDVVADPDRPVAVVFTSGTTGAPKGAVFTDRQLVAVTNYDTGGAWGDAPFAQYGSTQFAHVGFTTKLPWYLRLGSTTHLLDRWRAGDVLDLVERERISTIGGVAPQVALLLRDPELDQRDLSHVKLLVMGGSASPPALVEEARRRFDAGYSIRWSSTESGGIGTATAPDAPDDETLHTVGRPRPGMAIEVRDDDGRPLPADEVGMVWLRSDAVMSGYWDDPEQTASTLVGGWLRTGDLGRVDGEGRLVLAGRSGDMYIRGGYNVHPAEVEAVLGTHPGVHDVAVVPRADDVLGEIGVAVVVPTESSAPPDLAALRTHAGRVLSHHKLPEAIHVVDALPLTAMQKVDRRSLSATVAATDHEPDAPGSSTSAARG